LIFICKNKFMALVVVNFIVFGLTRPGLEPTIYHIWPLHHWFGSGDNIDSRYNLCPILLFLYYK
jgi:hypothetical protein